MMHSPKIELILQERGELLELIKDLDAILLRIDRGEITPEDVANISARLQTQASFERLIDWLGHLVRFDPSTFQERMNYITDVLDEEFPSFSSQRFRDEDGAVSADELNGQFANANRRSYVIFIAKAILDNSLILYAFERNSAAVIDLHSVLERRVIDALCDQLLVAEKRNIGLKLIERNSLQILAPLLRDCGIFNREDVKFCKKLSKLRNGLAHRNIRVISSVLMSGRELQELDIDTAVSDNVFSQYFVNSLLSLAKIMEHEAISLDMDDYPLGFLTEEE